MHRHPARAKTPRRRRMQYCRAWRWIYAISRFSPEGWGSLQSATESTMVVLSVIGQVLGSQTASTTPRVIQTSELGQNAKYSMRADVFRFASNIRHCSAAQFSGENHLRLNSFPPDVQQRLTILPRTGPAARTLWPDIRFTLRTIGSWVPSSLIAPAPLADAVDGVPGQGVQCPMLGLV